MSSRGLAQQAFVAAFPALLALSCASACGGAAPKHAATSGPSATRSHSAVAGTGADAGGAPDSATMPATAPTATQSVKPRLTADLVLATIRDHYLSGVERCYSRHAKRLGSANGRVIVSFTVDEDGSTRDGNAHGITKRVDGCIRAQVARWTFPAPRQESSFSLGLQLSTN